MPEPENTSVAVLPLRPKLRNGVVVHPPHDSEAPWTIEHDGRSYYRVGADMARLATELTGEYDQAELLEMLGPPWTADAISTSITKFFELGLLDDGSPARRKTRRVVVAPPMTIQISLFNPTRLLSPFSRTISLLGHRWSLATFGAIILAGFISLLFNVNAVLDVASRPLALEVIAIVFIGGFASTAIHELAHGATLVHYGGQPRRLGIMLFYFLPAFFCDVSDGWRLPRNQQRVRVALAGIYAQFTCAGVAALAALAAPTGTVKDGLLVLAVSMFAATTMNFIPFVKLDGYLALMSHLDVSNLRTLAMEDARNFLAAVLFGARRSPRLPGRRWIVPYGLVCMFFPLYLVGFVAFALWAEAVASTGILGAALVLAAFCGLIFAVLRGAWRLLSAAQEGGAHLPRLITVSGTAVAAVALIVQQVTVMSTVSGFYMTDDDAARLMVPDTSVTAEIEPGQTVELRTNGILIRRQIGEAEIGQGPPLETTMSSARFMPVSIDIDTPANYVERPLELTSAPDQAVGRARVEVGNQPIWRWAWNKYVAPVL